MIDGQAMTDEQNNSRGVVLSGGPFDGKVQYVPEFAPEGMFLKKAAPIDTPEFQHVQYIYKLMGSFLVFQGEERI